MNAVPSNGTRDEETLVFGRIVNRKKQYLIFFCSSVFKNYSDDTSFVKLSLKCVFPYYPLVTYPHALNFCAFSKSFILMVK